MLRSKLLMDLTNDISLLGEAFTAKSPDFLGMRGSMVLGRAKKLVASITTAELSLLYASTLKPIKTGSR